MEKNISDLITQLKNRIDKDLRMSDNDNPAEFEKTFKRLEICSSDLSRIEYKLKRLENLARVLIFAAKFLKKNLILQSANLVIALILLPILIHYLTFVIPDLKIAPPTYLALPEDCYHFRRYIRSDYFQPDITNRYHRLDRILL